MNRAMAYAILFVFAVFSIMQCKVHAEEIPRAALPYRAQLTREARYTFGMDAPIAMLAGQITQESNWDPNVRSRFASGLAQFTPDTAIWISGVYKLGTAQPLDPTWALRAMLRYDQRLYQGAVPAETECDRYQMVLEDYNGGTRRRLDRQRLSPRPGNYAITSVINPGISAANQAENASYPVRIIYRWQPLYSSWTTRLVCL